MVTILGKELTNEKAQDFGDGFLKAQPNTDPDNYTDLEWIEKRILDYARREYKHGKKLLANDAATVDDNILG